MSGAIERARADLVSGRAWKARQRLEGALANSPTSQPLLELLGEVCHRMGDLPTAGRYWFLTTRTGADVDAALSAMHEAYSGPAALLRALPVKSRASDYPAEVEARLRSLVEETPVDWFLQRKAMLLTGRDHWSPLHRPVGGVAGALGEGAAVLAIAIVVGLWILGLGTAVYLLWKLVTALL